MPHPNWEHEVDGGRISKFSTRDLSEYPKGYCQVVAKALVRYLRRVGCNKKHAFLEIFCGKNAPLTEAVREEISNFNCSFSATPQPSQLAVPEGCAEEVEPLLLQKPGRSPSFKQPSAYQLASRAVGLQPKWNTAYRLIADGINDQYNHFELAKALSHPGLDEGVLAPDLFGFCQCSSQ
jgi:hypothetical protein